MKLQPEDRRVDRFLTRQLHGSAFRFEAVVDPRKRRGRRWALHDLLDGAVDGMLAGRPTLRDVEDLTAEQARWGRRDQRVPDTTLYDLLPRLAVDGFRVALRQEVYGLYRSKCLEPVGLPCGVLSIDGKGIGTLDHHADGSAQKAHRSHDGSPYWLPRVLRATLTSSPVRPCLDQMTVPPETNEMGAFPAFFSDLLEAYGGNDLFEILTMDAGLTSRADADLVHGANLAYVMGLKDNQPELMAEAKRLLLPETSHAPEAQTPWEKAKGKLVRRSLFRTSEIAGYHGWGHLHQVWLVRQETRDKDGKVATEDRYFLTSIRRGRLTPAQILFVVRGHWGIENDCFGTLDREWREDDRPWCTKGHAVEVLGLIRLLAYNLLQVLRVRHLRRRCPRGELRPPCRWRQLFGWVRDALRLPPAKLDAI